MDLKSKRLNELFAALDGVDAEQAAPVRAALGRYIEADDMEAEERRRRAARTEPKPLRKFALVGGRW
jgi:hypothetical protein